MNRPFVAVAIGPIVLISIAAEHVHGQSFGVEWCNTRMPVLVGMAGANTAVSQGLPSVIHGMAAR